MSQDRRLSRRSFLGVLVAVPVATRFGPRTEFIWRTAQGEEIPILNLEDSHLLNIERMLRGDGRQSYERENREEAHVVVLKEVARRSLRTRPALWATRGRDLLMDEDGWTNSEFEDDE